MSTRHANLTPIMIQYSLKFTVGYLNDFNCLFVYLNFFHLICFLGEFLIIMREYNANRMKRLSFHVTNLHASVTDHREKIK